MDLSAEVVIFGVLLVIVLALIVYSIVNKNKCGNGMNSKVGAEPSSMGYEPIPLPDPQPPIKFGLTHSLYRDEVVHPYDLQNHTRTPEPVYPHTSVADQFPYRQTREEAIKGVAVYNPHNSTGEPLGEGESSALVMRRKFFTVPGLGKRNKVSGESTSLTSTGRVRDIYDAVRPLLPPSVEEN